MTAVSLTPPREFRGPTACLQDRGAVDGCPALEPALEASAVRATRPEHTRKNIYDRYYPEYFSPNDF
jgi:hypothetical protein